MNLAFTSNEGNWNNRVNRTSITEANIQKKIELTKLNSISSAKEVIQLKKAIENKRHVCHKLDQREKTEVHKAIYLCVSGASLVILGCIFTYLYFQFRPFCCETIGDDADSSSNCDHGCSEELRISDKKKANAMISGAMQTVGPITLASGLLMMVCGLVWVPIIRDRYEKMRPKDHDHHEEFLQKTLQGYV